MQPVKRFVPGLLILMSALLLVARCSRQTRYLPVNGPYLGQTPPGDEPQLFAPGIVCTGLEERDLTMTPDGKEIYFGRKVGGNAFVTLLVTKEINGKWTKPEVVPNMSDPNYFNLEPCISPDGKRFFFISNRPDTTQGETEEEAMSNAKEAIICYLEGLEKLNQIKSDPKVLTREVEVHI